MFSRRVIVPTQMEGIIDFSAEYFRPGLETGDVTRGELLDMYFRWLRPHSTRGHEFFDSMAPAKNRFVTVDLSEIYARVEKNKKRYEVSFDNPWNRQARLLKPLTGNESSDEIFNLLMETHVRDVAKMHVTVKMPGKAYGSHALQVLSRRVIDYATPPEGRAVLNMALAYADATAKHRIKHSTSKQACAACGRNRLAGDAKFKKCSRCGEARYCNVACQAAHFECHRWPCKARSLGLPESDADKLRLHLEVRAGHRVAKVMIAFMFLAALLTIEIGVRTVLR